ncbi:hypothetical protein MRQ36_07100 [Micromonospora sp. R77]|uniref:hypothetical protein n=1 Tax=Micromonospora sp. R77 TaxID=2925836 RepID=UPI001F605507|nr:hypothetical protein [Micromonospora sp. R77]MCI4062340.1 hypothetical protein [Micromonospora sp. R77]
MAHLVDALAAAIRVGDPELLVDHVRWQDEALAARGGRPLLDAVLASCAQTLAEHPRAGHHLRLARAATARN